MHRFHVHLQLITLAYSILVVDTVWSSQFKDHFASLTTIAVTKHYYRNQHQHTGNNFGMYDTNMESLAFVNNINKLLQDVTEHKHLCKSVGFSKSTCKEKLHKSIPMSMWQMYIPVVQSSLMLNPKNRRIELEKAKPSSWLKSQKQTRILTSF